ncbi:MAG TPA: APC family permease [Ktedonobacteraceae bacterium]|nr:APC family permease [Ktedonobacteraceae bacterium]
MATVAEGGGGVLRSERIAGGILPKVLNSFDMVAIFVAIVLFITNSAVATSINGASTNGSAYIYWILGFITFLIPGAIVTGQLGLMFPGEGSIYVWTNKAFGAFLGFFAGFCAWWPGVLVMIATGDVVVSFIQQLGGQFNANFLVEPWQQGAVIVAVIAFSFFLSVLRFRLTQNFVNIVFVAYGGAILLVGLAGVLWLVTGHPSNTNFSLTAHNWLPNGSTASLYGLIILALLGIEVPLNMGVEINNMRSITRYLLWGSVVVMVAYLIGTFGVQLAVPVKDQPNPSAIAEAVQLGFGGAGRVLGVIVNLIIIGFFIFNTAVYNYSFGRLLFVSGLDRRMPTVMSKVNANRVPWVAVLVQSIISVVFTIVAFIVMPLTLKTGFGAAGLSTVVYDILQAAVTVIWCVSMVILFIDVIIIRYKYQDVFARIRLAPIWVFYVCAIVGAIATGYGVYVTFTNPWTGLLGEQQWWLWIGGIGVLSLLVGALLYFVGRATIRRDVSDEEVIAQVTGEAAGGE